MDKAIIELAESNSNTINQYMVAAMKNENEDYILQWVLVSNLLDDLLAEKLDELLHAANKNCAVVRSKSLKAISVKTIS